MKPKIYTKSSKATGVGYVFNAAFLALASMAAAFAIGLLIGKIILVTIDRASVFYYARLWSANSAIVIALAGSHVWYREKGFGKIIGFILVVAMYLLVVWACGLIYGLFLRWRQKNKPTDNQ